MKPISEFYEPDSRFQHHVIVNEETYAFRRMEVADLYGMVESLTLSSAVPEAVRSQFELARDTFVHSWFVYDFATLAERQAYATLEAALRHRYRETTGKPADRLNLKNLFDFAIAHRWIASSDFEYQMTGAPGGKWSELEMIRTLRNNLAHGKFHLMLNGSHQAIQACHYIITRLFPQVDAATSHKFPEGSAAGA